MRFLPHYRHSAWRLALVAMVAALFLIGCASNPEPGTPKLPPGFLQAEIPAGDLFGYLYVSQDPPATISLNLLGDLRAASLIDSASAASVDVGIGDLAAWVGPTLDAFGGRMTFSESVSTEVAVRVLSSQGEVDVWRDGRRVLFVRGYGDWSIGVNAALRSGNTRRFQDAYPETWELMGLLPADPPVEPVAAGFSRVSGGTLGEISLKTGLDLGSLSQAFGAINVTEIVFAAYADDTIAIPAQIDRDFLTESRVGAVIVARSTYPGFILSFFLNSFSDQIGLTEGPTIHGEEVLARELDGVHLLVKPIGNTIFLSIAPSRAMAEALMASAIGPQLEE